MRYKPTVAIHRIYLRQSLGQPSDQVGYQIPLGCAKSTLRRTTYARRIPINKACAPCIHHSTQAGFPAAPLGARIFIPYRPTDYQRRKRIERGDWYTLSGVMTGEIGIWAEVNKVMAGVYSTFALY